VTYMTNHASIVWLDHQQQCTYLHPFKNSLIYCELTSTTTHQRSRTGLSIHGSFLSHFTLPLVLLYTEHVTKMAIVKHIHKHILSAPTNAQFDYIRIYNNIQNIQNCAFVLNQFTTHGMNCMKNAQTADIIIGWQYQCK
jgi:hypothetical protein